MTEITDVNETEYHEDVGFNFFGLGLVAMVIFIGCWLLGISVVFEAKGFLSAVVFSIVYVLCVGNLARN